MLMLVFFYIVFLFFYFRVKKHTKIAVERLNVSQEIKNFLLSNYMYFSEVLIFNYFKKHCLFRLEKNTIKENKKMPNYILINNGKVLFVEKNKRIMFKKNIYNKDIKNYVPHLSLNFILIIIPLFFLFGLICYVISFLNNDFNFYHLYEKFFGITIAFLFFISFCKIFTLNEDIDEIEKRIKKISKRKLKNIISSCILEDIEEIEIHYEKLNSPILSKHYVYDGMYLYFENKNILNIKTDNIFYNNKNITKFLKENDFNIKEIKKEDWNLIKINFC